MYSWIVHRNELEKFSQRKKISQEIECVLVLTKCRFFYRIPILVALLRLRGWNLNINTSINFEIISCESINKILKFFLIFCIKMKEKLLILSIYLDVIGIKSQLYFLDYIYVSVYIDETMYACVHHTKYKWKQKYFQIKSN